MTNHPNRRRETAVKLSPAEARAAFSAISQMTDGNARDFTEWRKSTSGTKAEWLALLRAEAKIYEAMCSR